MNKKAIYNYNDGMNQDFSKSKHPASSYYNAKNIRIINTDSQSSYSVSNEKGNSFMLEIPSLSINNVDRTITYGTKNLSFDTKGANEIVNSDLPSTSSSQKIIGHCITKNSIILITTDDNKFDCIWEVKNLYSDNNQELELLYCRNLNLTINNPVQILFNYENEKIQKIYWVDGVNQLRFLNIKQSKENGDADNLIDLNSTSLNIVSNYSLSQPSLVDLSGGGTHTSGIIQYSYNLYNLNGSQTTISPFSELIPLDKGATLGGGDINEIVGTNPLISISSIDPNYTHIKIYAIKYTSYNEIPSVSLITDETINNYSYYTFTDTGSKINDVSLAEFIFLGSNPIIPKHIETKDNRLFVSNYKESAYDLDIDCRAYSHNTLGSTNLFNTKFAIFASNETFTNNTPIENYNYSKDSYAINPNYDVYKYHKNGTTLGGEGLFISYELLQKEKEDLKGDLKYLKFFKDEEIYRIGIQFYNNLGQKTDAKWIADFKAPKGNLEGNYNILKVNIKTTEFNNYIDSLNLEDNDKPVGYKILRARRDIKDMTILCQGSLTGMMTQSTSDVQNFDLWKRLRTRVARSKDFVKIPIPLVRGFSNPDNEDVIFPTEHLKMMNEGRGEDNDEIYRDNDKSFKRQQSWQYTKIMQMHSPDILFNTGLRFGNGLSLKVKGISNHSRTNKKFKQYNVESKSVVREGSEYNNDKLKFTATSKHVKFGIIGPVFDADKFNMNQFTSYNRQYLNYQSTLETIKKPIYISPEITERGQGATPYNGNSIYNYSNTLESLITDRHKDDGSNEAEDPEITSVNSFGERCLTIVLGGDNDIEAERPSLEDLKPTDIANDNGLLIAEVVREANYKYTGDIYGGLSNEDKTRTDYIEIGSYQDLIVPYLNIYVNSIEIENCGDTFVQNFIFGRILKTDTEIYNKQVRQLTEIIEHPIETTINLQNRSDTSLLGWDNKFQPRYDEFHNYNRVYSQSSNLITNQTDNIKVKKLNEFNNRIISSKLKVSGEFIDSWTDFLENETLDLDGKYGPINSIISFNDTLYALQDRALAKIGVNPRVQTQGSDGLSIELGTGGILYDYNYMTTDSGTLNKWSVFTSPYGLYYFDLINKSYNKFNNQVINISSMKGLHAYFQNNVDYNSLVTDNPLLRQGIIGGYDDINKEALLTLLQGDKSFTVGFNDKNDKFTSFYDYLPSLYINRGFKNIMVNPDNNKLYTSFEGDYNTFFDNIYPSYITLLLNPESNVDCIFDNIEYNSELYLNDIDQSDKTLTHITAWNEYQNSGKIPLMVGRNTNLKRRFRKWRANIPREGRQRMRNPWIYLKLELDNVSNYKLILHDIIVSYTV